ncbi:linoleoyl-CoA desaturase activity [Linnemannia exigua]|uniref:Linoleoyl-CoA desaturase activity n=1 Tax=Linnemannia exigua TaxID=604196 RepID=A0AAD4DME9_9FUNG|nr:linoleoyl-CoA desaturase activity [Linnemannia exigua]
MAPPHVVEDQVRRRIVVEDEAITAKQQYERNYVPMDFTIKEIRDAIPAHLFVRDTTKSIMHVVKDLVTIAAVFYCATFIDTLPSLALRVPAWIAYWIIQGTVMVGPWILAHECGHGAFSDSKTVNTIFGWVLHSALLQKQEELNNSNQEEHHDHHHESIFAETPLFTLGSLIFILTLGWPLYLFINFSGPSTPHWINHFQTIAPLYEPHQAKNIFYSNCGIVAMTSILTYLSILFSPMTVFMYYGIPYLGVNAWIVCITYLQHTDPQVPHFRDNVWNFQRGAACTVDRSFGTIVNHLHHHIGDSHQCHHMFSQMPFYNAVEATKHLKAKLGKYYIFDDTPIAKALYRNWRECRFVEDEGEVVFYKH